MSHAAVTMEELLADFEETAERWKAFFAANPGAAEVQTDIMKSGNVAALVWHIYAAATRHSERLLKEPVSDLEGANPVKNLEAAWQLQARAAANMQRYLATADDAELNEVMTFTGRTGVSASSSRRKLYLHVMVHAIRHWAQIGPLVRHGGYQPGWQQDILFSTAIS